MIQLHHDYLLFQTASGESIPCSVEMLAIELVGESAAKVDPEVVRQAAAAVLHYFRSDLGRNSVSVGEFSLMLERVLTALGVNIKSFAPAESKKVEVSDLRKLAFESGEGFELAFFPQLREEMQRKLKTSPQMIRFQGLRGCVKQMLGAKRWSNRCQVLNDQIVEYMRECLTVAEPARPCGLDVR